MTLGALEGIPQVKRKIPMQEALNAAWTKIGMLSFQLDMLQQMNQALEDENKRLKDEKGNLPRAAGDANSK